MDLEARIARLEAESAIRQLIARYCFSIDDRRVAEIAALFTADAVVTSADGVMNAEGVDAIMAQYAARFAVLGPGAHYMHDIRLDFQDADHATGLVSGHAELERNATMMVTALRYHDAYRRTDAGWRIARRQINFLYYVDVADYPGIMLHKDRNRAYATPKPADFPEALPGWARGDLI
jgi:ketosteroid isomerase-like protein